MTDNDSSGVSEAETRRSGGASTSGELEDVEDSRAFQVRRRRRTRPVDPRSSPLPGEFHPRKTLSGHIWHAPSRRSTAFCLVLFIFAFAAPRVELEPERAASFPFPDRIRRRPSTRARPAVPSTPGSPRRRRRSSGSCTTRCGPPRRGAALCPARRTRRRRSCGGLLRSAPPPRRAARTWWWRPSGSSASSPRRRRR